LRRSYSGPCRGGRRNPERADRLERLVDYLRLGRIHTAPATVILLLSSYAAGGGSLFSPLGAMLLLYGILLHWTAFGHNVVMDYWWDLSDPGKSHHPLTAGRIKLNDAVNLVLSLLGACLVIGLLFAWGDWLATFWFAVFAVSGFLYNNWLSKTTIWGWIPITSCFTGLGVYAMSLAGNINIAYALYIMFTIWFQIGWSGYLKEIRVESQANMLRKLGARVEGGRFRASKAARAWGVGIKTANIAVGCYLVSLLPFPMQFIPAILLGVMAAMLVLLVEDRDWDRERELRNMSVMEIATIYAGMFAVMPIHEAAALAAFGAAWFTGMNRLLWSTRLTPRV